MDYIITNTGEKVLVSPEDYHTVSLHQWYFQRRSRNVIRSRKLADPRSYPRTFSIHRFIMGFPNNQWIDHINGDPLDNRRSNLRLCNPSQNGCNRRNKDKDKGFISGVTWHSNIGKWRARISINKEEVSLGYFDREEDAIGARMTAMIEYYGEFTRLPDSWFNNITD